MKKKFTKRDFNSFSSISGDKNPLHHDENYAKSTEFSQIIVPMHLIAAPLSSVAGMVFPGHRSLYLSHEVKSHLPVFFDQEITYSSKIIEKNDAEKILIIRTIVYCDTDVLLSAVQKVKVREDSVDTKILKKTKINGSLLSNKMPYTLITGAAGEIGQALTMQLAKQGKNLILIVRKLNKNNIKFVNKAKEFSANILVVEIDLSSKKVKTLFDNFIMKNNVFIETVVFAASPNINSDINQQIAVNYSSVKSITDSCLPYWLERQHGRILFLSSSATHYHPLGFDDYATAKAAGTNYLDGIRKRFLQWGVKVYCLASGKVDTKFSDSLNAQIKSQMLPEQVAETIMTILEDQNSSNYYWLEKTGLRKGSYDFISNDVDSKKEITPKSRLLDYETFAPESEKLKSLMTDFFLLGDNVNWDNVGIGLIPGWDSLRHIEFILEMEKIFSIKFSAQEIDLTTTYKDLNELLERK